MIKNELYNSLQGLNESLNNVLKYPYLTPSDKSLENFLYSLEKRRFEIYEQVRFYNKTTCDNEIPIIDNKYKADFKAGVLSIYIPEKLPT